jgi:hypothetical protein
MSDDSEVRQRFIADAEEYIQPIRDCARAARDFADGDRAAREALDALRDAMASSEPVLRELASSLHAAMLATAEQAAAADEADVALAEYRDKLLEVAEAAAKMRDDTAEAGTTGIPLLDKAMKSARDKAAELAAASDYLGLSLDAMASGTKRARDRLIELGFAEADAAAGAAALTAAASAAKDAETGGGGFLANAFSTLPDWLTSTQAAIVAIAVAIGATLLPELAGIAAGFTAAGLGVGSFVALALPAFDKIKNGYSSVSQAQAAYHAAVALEARDPTKANAQAVATALAKLKIAWSDLSPAARQGVHGIDELKSAYDRMAKAFTPDAMKVFDDGLKIANELLPQVKPFADTAASALGGMLKGLAGFLEPARKAVPVTENMASAAQRLGINVSQQLTPWQQFTQYMHSLEGPALKAIGTGMAGIGTNLGKLLQVMSRKDVINAINIAFGTIIGTIRTLRDAVIIVMGIWDEQTAQLRRVRADFDALQKTVRDDFGRIIVDAALFYNEVTGWITRTVDEVEARWTTGWARVNAYAHGIPGRIISAIGDLGGLLIHDGAELIRGLISGIESAIPGLESAISFVRGLVSSIGGLLSGGGGGGGGGAPRGPHSGLSAGLAAPVPAPALAGGGGPVNIHVHVDMQNIMSQPRQQQALAAHVQSAVLDYASRAGGSFLVLPGKGAGI